MTKRFLTITYIDIDNNDFYLILHAAYNQIGNFQWYLTDNLNDKKEEYLGDEVYESITLSQKWIKENAEGKWIGCHCLLKDNECTEILCRLSSDICELIRQGTFEQIDVLSANGNFGSSYSPKDF